MRARHESPDSIAHKNKAYLQTDFNSKKELRNQPFSTEQLTQFIESGD